jgi:hypothetical protein
MWFNAYGERFVVTAPTKATHRTLIHAVESTAAPWPRLHRLIG